MHRIALEELNRDLSSNRAAVDSWAQAKLSAAEDLRDHHVQTLRRLQGKTHVLLTEKMFEGNRTVVASAESCPPQHAGLHGCGPADDIARLEGEKARRMRDVDNMKASEVVLSVVLACACHASAV